MFEKIVSDALSKHLASDEFKANVEEAVNSTVEAAIGDAVGYHSTFRKQLKEHVNAIMPDVESEDWTLFEAAFRSAARQQLTALADKRAEETVSRLIAELSPDDDRTIELDELKRQLAQFVHDENSAVYPDVDYIEFGDDVDERHSSNYVYFSREAPVSDTVPNFFDLTIEYLKAGYRSGDTPVEISLGFSFDHGGNHEAKMWRISGIQFGDLFSGPYFGFKSTLFRLYTGQLRLVGVENPTAAKTGAAS